LSKTAVLFDETRIEKGTIGILELYLAECAKQIEIKMQKKKDIIKMLKKED